MRYLLFQKFIGNIGCDVEERVPQSKQLSFSRIDERLFRDVRLIGRSCMIATLFSGHCVSVIVRKRESDQISNQLQVVREFDCLSR